MYAVPAKIINIQRPQHFQAILSFYRYIVISRIFVICRSPGIAEWGRSEIIDWSRSSLSSTYGFEPGKFFFFSHLPLAPAYLFHISDFLTSFVDRDYYDRGSLPSKPFRFRICHGLLNCFFFKLECETRARIAYVDSSPAYRHLRFCEILAAG